ncbi:MAG: T9SS type A sorting domain-containing protein, partial [Bacteroidales bacterium]|nr:T9SS type A sorting domain-containing protein [Bacteroidales bacterium]
SKFDGVIWHNLASDGLLDNHIQALEINNNNDLILGFGMNQKGISVFNQQNWKDTIFDSFANKHINDIHIDTSGDIWLGTDNNIGLVQSDSIKYLTTSDGLTDEYIKSIHVDRKGNMWFGTSNGISRFDGTNWSSYHKNDVGGNRFTSISDDSKGRIWCGHDYKGVYYLKDTNWTNYTKSNGLLNNNTRDIAVDSNDDVWIVQNAGVCQFIDTICIQHNLYDSFGAGVSRVSIDEFGKAWFGADGGYFTYDSLGWHFENFGENFNFYINDIRFDSYGNTWMGTDNNGLIKIPGIPKFLNITTDSIHFKEFIDSAIVDISSNINWEVISTKSWVNISKSFGSDDASIKVKVDKNPGKNSRSANVVFYGPGVDTVKLIVYQRAGNFVSNKANNKQCNDLVLYPNPVNDILKVKSTNKTKISSMTVTNLHGNTLLHESVNEYETNIDFTLFSDGVYIIQLKTNNGIYRSVVVNRK